MDDGYTLRYDISDSDIEIEDGTPGEWESHCHRDGEVTGCPLGAGCGGTDGFRKWAKTPVNGWKWLFHQHIFEQIPSKFWNVWRWSWIPMPPMPIQMPFLIGLNLGTFSVRPAIHTRHEWTIQWMDQNDPGPYKSPVFSLKPGQVFAHANCLEGPSKLRYIAIYSAYIFFGLSGDHWIDPWVPPRGSQGQVFGLGPGILQSPAGPLERYHWSCPRG